ncbi:MAG: 50S ribosomal protein L10 [Bernardetiaceae bacterium]|jgi:large subunit ribosomal protein L10|nr:50S ribosomal protein L10 [Bernardetiaceae bacterium]
MTREEKDQIVEELSGKFADCANFYITDASGMTVAQTNAFRRSCFEKGIEYRVVKNTLIKKALERMGKGDFSPFDEAVFKGFSGIMFSPENPKLPAELLKEFRKKAGKKETPKPQLKGASISLDLFIGDNQLDALVNLKSKEDLLGEIIGLLQSPMSNVLGALQSGGNTIHGVLKTLGERQG